MLLQSREARITYRGPLNGATTVIPAESVQYHPKRVGRRHGPDRAQGGRARPLCVSRAPGLRPSRDPGRREGAVASGGRVRRSEEHTPELQSPCNLVCRLLLEKKKNI